MCGLCGTKKFLPVKIVLETDFIDLYYYFLKGVTRSLGIKII